MTEQKIALTNRIELAGRMIGYFQSFHNEGHSFAVGLYLASQWRKYLSQERPDLEELRLFANALESGAKTNGSGWYELTLGVKNWFVELEAIGEFS